MDEVLSQESLKEIESFLEVEPASWQDVPGPDIPSLRENLAVLVSTGKAKEAIGVQLTHEHVKRLSDKDVEKYSKRYEAYVGSKTTESLVDSFLFLATKALGMKVKIKDIAAYQKELKEDYILNKELSNLFGNVSLKYGRGVALANAAMITAKHIDFDSPKAQQIPQQFSTSVEQLQTNGE